MSLTPVTILRDAALAGLAIVVAGWIGGEAVATGAGAAAGVANYALIWRAAASGTAMVARLLGAHVVAFVMLAVLLSNFPAAPVLAGFCAPLLALAVRGLVGWLRPPHPEHA